MNLDEIRKRTAATVVDVAVLIAVVEAADKLVESTSEFDPSDFPELWDTFDARRTAYLKVRGDV